MTQAKRFESSDWSCRRMLTANTAPSSSSRGNALWRLSITTAISGGSADTEANAETVRPWMRSPARMVVIVTPAGNWDSAFLNSSDEIAIVRLPLQL